MPGLEMSALLLLGVFMGLGTPELIILGVIVLLLFGSRLPSAMRSLGMSLNSFKKGMKEGEEEAAKIDESDEKET
jgi:sec-independent protein translocase protein TatA